MDKRTGFTLIEIIVATVIFSLVVLGMAGLFIAGKRHIIHSRNRMTGSEIGKFFIDPLQMDVHQVTWDANALKVGTTNGPSIKVDNVDYVPQYIVSDVALPGGATLRRVKAKISWTEE